jgi:dentin sialophosphoprotein (fragment)
MNFSLKDATMIKYTQEDHLVPVYRSHVSMSQEDYTDDVSRSQEDVDDPTETKLILKDKTVEDDKMTADDLTNDPEKAKEVEEAHPELTEEVEEEEANDTDAIGDASSDNSDSDDSSSDDNNDSDSDLSVDDDIKLKEDSSKDNKDDSSKHEEMHEESSETTTSSDDSSTTTVSSSSTASTESYYYAEAHLLMEVLLRKPDISLESYRHIETSLNYLESRLFKDYVPVLSVEERTENRVKLIKRASKVLDQLPFKARMPVHRPVFSLEDFMLEDSHYAIIDPSKDIPSQITTQIDILESRDQPKLFKVGHEVIKDDSTCDCELKERVYHALESLQDLTPIQGKVLSILHHYVIHKAI